MPETPQINEYDRAEAPETSEQGAVGGTEQPSTPAAEKTAAETVSPPGGRSISFKLRKAISVLSLGLRTVLTATIAAFREPPPADGANTSSVSELLEDAQQHTLSTSLERAREEIQELRAELKDSRQLLGQRKHEIHELKTEIRRSAEAAAAAENRIRADLEGAQAAIRAKDAEIARMTSQVAQLTVEVEQQRSALEEGRSRLAATEADAARQRADMLVAQQGAVEAIKQEAAQEHGELQRQLQQASDAAAQTAARNTELQARLDDSDHRLNILGDVSQRLTAIEKELSAKTEEADLLRADLLAQRRRVTELESELGKVHDRNNVQEDLQREVQRRTMQLEVLNEELAKFRTRSEKLEVTLREFYLQAIDPITVAAASADLAASSEQLSVSDRENVAAVREKLDGFLSLLKRLVSDMNELGIVVRSKD